MGSRIGFEVRERFERIVDQNEDRDRIEGLT